MDGGMELRRTIYNGNGKAAATYIVHSVWGSCNDEGHEIGKHILRNDTLIIYTYWCHAGDPTGHNYGARILKFFWDRSNKQLKPIDGRIYLEMQGNMGGFPVMPYDDKFIVQEREKFKREAEIEHHAKFVIGKEAKLLLNESYDFLKPEINKIASAIKDIYVDSGFGWRIEPDL